MSSTTELVTPQNRFPSGFAVIDVETTGLRWKGDRIIEIAVVRLDVAGQVVAEYVTLVDPERHPGATHIHGLSADDLQGAPRFGEVLQDLVRHLEGAVLVGHNVTFDASFLREEFFRSGLTMPRVPLLCTREMSQTVHPRLGDYRLAACCKAYTVPQGTEHRALEDARATAQLFVHLWNEEIIQRDAPRDVQHARSIAWPVIAETSRVFTRDDATKQRKVESSRLGEFVTSLPEGHTTNDSHAYVRLLDDVLEDRLVSDEDLAAVKKTVESNGLLRQDLVDVHQAYLTNLCRLVLDAGLDQDMGAEEITLVARLLGLSDDDKNKAMTTAQGTQSSALRRLGKPLPPGATVCFTGNPIPSKHELEGRAIAAGLYVKESVTKKLDLLVVDEPRSMSNKAQKARTTGIRIMAVPVFLLHLKALKGA